ncbi:MAG: hypothetical protein FWG34_12980 [Oscillospiraceae bacterium]|nr:hypothetical protein [Oscillospiraceae bacterium]
MPNNLIDLCKGRYPAGLFYFAKELWTEDGVRQAADTGADFIMAVESLEPLVGLCEKHGLGIISTSNTTPMWWGGDGDNAGGYANQFPLDRLDEIQKTYPKSPAVWGDYPVDEPNSKDFLHIDKVAKRYRELFPDKLPFINLYPNYASIPKNTGEEVVSQLGNFTYAEHIEQYVREVDLPYICFDYYPFTGVFSSYLENLDIVASACRKSGKEMWVIIQTGAWKAEAALEAFQLDWQVYLCLSYGAKSIIHASYSKGWWDETTSCVNLKGEKNPMYSYAKDINAVLHSPLGSEFLKYEYLGTGICGDMASSDSRIKEQLAKQAAKELPAGLPDVKIESDKAAAIGYFKKGDGFAIMATNAHNPFDGSVSASLKLETAAKKQINIHGGKKSSGSVKTSGDVSVVELELESGQGAFVTFN